MENNQNFIFEQVEDYYNLPVYMSEYHIEKLIIGAIDDYNNGKYSYDDIVRIMYALSDSFSCNIESMDLSDDVKNKLEEFVLKLWKYDDDANTHIVMKIILDFGLQGSYDKIINNIESLKNINYDAYNFLNEVVMVNGNDISNSFKKHENDRML